MSGFIRAAAKQTLGRCLIALCKNGETAFVWGTRAFGNFGIFRDGGRLEGKDKELMKQKPYQDAINALRTYHRAYYYKCSEACQISEINLSFGRNYQKDVTEFWLDLDCVESCFWLDKGSGYGDSVATIMLTLWGVKRELSVDRGYVEEARRFYEGLKSQLEQQEAPAAPAPQEHHLTVVRIPETDLLLEQSMRAVVRQLPDGSVQAVGIQEGDRIRDPTEEEIGALRALGVRYGAPPPPFEPYPLPYSELFFDSYLQALFRLSPGGAFICVGIAGSKGVREPNEEEQEELAEHQITYENKPLIEL